MNQYPGSRSGGDPDSRSEQPAVGHRFGGGLHGLPASDAAQDPDRVDITEGIMHTVDSDFVENQKTKFRAEATGGGGDTSVGTESGMGDESSSTGTAADDDGAKSNLTGSQESTSAVGSDLDVDEKNPGTNGASKPN